MELDHIFICVSDKAPQGEAVKAIGLVEGSQNVHPGQGTANRRFFFHNAFLELLFLTDAAEAKSKLTQPTKLYERITAADQSISPFGICFRPSESSETVPFASWEYKPTYLPPDLKVDVGNAPLTEPMWFFLPFGSRPDQAPSERRQPLEHPNGMREISSVRLTVVTDEPFSDAATSAAALENIKIVRGEAPLIEISFDQEADGKTHDFRPELPLIFHW
ncbi:MAG: VOC family protein [Chloroflexota bacterium]